MTTGGYPPLGPKNGNSMGDIAHGRRIEDSEEFSKITNFDLYQMIQSLDRKLDSQSARTESHIEAQQKLAPKIEEVINILDRSKFLVGVVVVLSMIIGGLWALIDWSTKHIHL